MKENKLRVVCYNLHGIQRNNDWRFGKIAFELAKVKADICGLQEVINGNGIEDTSYQIAYHMNNITGLPYTTHWIYCHDFNDTYPEGVSVLSCHGISNVRKIDLNNELSCKFKPLLTRYALSAEILFGKEKILFTTVHLDHHKDRKLRASQAEKLIKELEANYNMEEYRCSIITGDLNDLDKSPCLNYFKEEGYKDSYRETNAKGGNTFHSSRPTVRIDYILVKGDVKIEKSELIVYDSSLSDHIGILTTLGLDNIEEEKEKECEEKIEEIILEKCKEQIKEKIEESPDELQDDTTEKTPET